MENTEPKKEPSNADLLDFGGPPTDSFAFDKPLPPEPNSASLIEDFLKAEAGDFGRPSSQPSDADLFGEFDPPKSGGPSGRFDDFKFDSKGSFDDDFEEDGSPVRDSPPLVPRPPLDLPGKSPSPLPREPSPLPKEPTPPPKEPTPPPKEPTPPPKEPTPPPTPKEPTPPPKEPTPPPKEPTPPPKEPTPPREPTPPPLKPKEEVLPAPKIPPRERPGSASDIAPKDLFSNIGLDAWFNPGRLHPKVESLVYWRDVKKSGVVFGVSLACLLSLLYCSLISVLSYLCLLTLFATISFRIYKNVMQAVQKTSDGHPFKELLEVDLEIKEERARECVGTLISHLNSWLSELRRLFLVVDLVDSLKFGVCLWALTYVGALFNGLSLIILCWIALFTLPKVYENNKQQIDAYLELATAKISEITNKVKAALPGKKEEKKDQ